MAKRDVGFIDKHLEKAVLGLCLLLLVGAAAFSFGGFRFRINDRDPGALCAEAKTQADLLAGKVRNARPRKNNPTNQGREAADPVKELSEWYGRSARGLIDIAQVQPRLPRTQTFPPLVEAISGVNREDRHHLVRIVTPSVPIITTGRTMLEIPRQIEFVELVNSGPETRDTTLSKRSWVSVATQVDLVEQGANFSEEGYPPGEYPTILKVHLQRRDQTETWQDWEDVDIYLPFKQFKRPQVGESLVELRGQLDEVRTYIERTTLPKRRTGDRLELPWVPYLDDPPRAREVNDTADKLRQQANRRSRTWRERARKAAEGKTPSKIKDLDAALSLVRAALASGAGDSEIRKAEQLFDTIVKGLSRKQRDRVLNQEPRAPERLMPLLAHDLTAVPGHTYRYRTRYEILNRYAGIPGQFVNPLDADRLTIFSDWSPPSRPVEIKSDVRFFLTKADSKRREVTVTVYKDTRTGQKNKKFKIKVGEPIGRNDARVQKVDYTTDAVCIDIDFDRIVDQKKTVAMVYLDTNTGLLRERLLSVDRKQSRRR